MVHATNLTKRYGRLTALHDVSFSIREGEILGLIGPNGSGKTTTVNVLTGVYRASGGSVVMDGRPLTGATGRPRCSTCPTASRRGRRRQCDGRWSSCSSSFNGIRPGSDTVSDPRLSEVIEQLDLEVILDSTIGTLSKGQRKRALLAMGLLIPRPILLADEPFEGLDLRQSRDVAQTLRAHAAGGRTMFLSIHQIGDAARVCDRFVLLSGGRVCGEGTLPELSALAAARSGSPATDDLEEVFLALT